MTSLIHERNDSFIFRKHMLSAIALLVVVSTLIFLPEILGIHPPERQPFSETLRVHQKSIARNVNVNVKAIDDVIRLTAHNANKENANKENANKEESLPSEQVVSEDLNNSQVSNISPDVAQVGLRARQASAHITDSSPLQPVFESTSITPTPPKFAILSWEDLKKSEIQVQLKRISSDTAKLITLLSPQEFPRSNFELRSFQSALHPLLTPKSRKKGTSLMQVLEFLDYRDSMVTNALVQEHTPRQTKLAWKSISLKPILNNSLSQQKKAEMNTNFRPQFYLTEAQFRFDWTNKKEKRLLTPLRAEVSGAFNGNDIASLEWYYSDNPGKRHRARIRRGKEKNTFFIPWSGDVRHSTLIIIAVAQDGSQYAKAYRFKEHLDKFHLRPIDRFWMLQYPKDGPNKQIDSLFLVAQGVKKKQTEVQQRLALRSVHSELPSHYGTF